MKVVEYQWFLREMNFSVNMNEKKYYCVKYSAMLYKGLGQPRPKHSILRSYINWRVFVIAALLIKPKQQHEKYKKQKHWFVYKLYGFCYCAYKNEQKIISSLFSYVWALGASLICFRKSCWLTGEHNSFIICNIY
jgi:hypothetical protein